MCGIAVAIGWENAEATVRQMVGGLQHRGNISDPVVAPFRDAAMGTRRLPIVDGAHAIQPQLSHDDRILVSFNGEIYNHAALRRELEALGVVFRTESDTEVLACALSHWGVQALGRLNGMYAFVALDRRDGTFLAARDPFGVKPLYFIMSKTGFVFCSEIRPLLSAVDVGDVLFLPPGYALTRKACVPFHSLHVKPDVATATHDARTLDGLLAAAVEIRTPTDLPVALMFSGGIDSTLVAHYALRSRPDVAAYFLGGPQAPDYEHASRYAEQSHLDLRHVDFGETGLDTREQIGHVVEAIETFEPDIVRNGLCTYLLSKRIHDDGFRVALTGEGADELFAGYPTLEVAFADGNIPGAFVRDQHIASLHKTALQRLDRCSMRFQLEAREPFLDPSVAAYALGLESTALVRTVGGAIQGKAPLRSLYDLYPHALPGSIRSRQKVPLNEGSGFDGSQTAAPWREFADQTVSESDFADGKKRFAVFDLRSKEELLYLETLAGRLDVTRVPHLASRTRMLIPAVRNIDMLRAYMVEP